MNPLPEIPEPPLTTRQKVGVVLFLCAIYGAPVALGLFLDNQRNKQEKGRNR